MNPTVVRCGVTALSLLLAGLLLAQDPKSGKPAGKPPTEEEEAPKKKAGDDKGKKPPTEEEEAAKPKKPVPKDTEEEGAVKPRKPIPRDDDASPPKKPLPRDDDSSPPKRPGNTNAARSDLAAEAAKATHPNVRSLYQSLSIPADYIQLRRNTELLMVDPLPEYIGARSNNAPVAYRPFGPDGKLGAAGYTATPGEILKAVSYEERALEAVSNFILDMQNFSDGQPRFLPRADYLAVADKVLTSVNAFHEAARGADKRKGPGWDAVRGHLSAKLLEVLSDELKALIASSKPDAADKATDLALRMTELFPKDIQARREIQMWKLSLVNNDLSANDTSFFEAAQELQKLQAEFPGADGKVLEPIRDALKRRSQAHFDEAKRLAGTEDGKPAAQRQLDMAMKIWAELPGLREYQRAVLRDFRMMVVGVRRLPEMMSPALAITDSDRYACELLFESLVRPMPYAAVGQLYQPGLALRLPRTISMGREFELPRDAVWVDRSGKAEKLDSSDVRGTVAMLQEHSRLPVAANIDLLSEPSIQDAHRFPLRLERGCLDPLSALTFKVLPARLLAARRDKLLDREFALNPVGSGPFVYHGRKTEDGREYAVFKSNPYYSKRTGHFGLPRMQEIRFVVAPADPAADLRDGRIDVLLDVPTAEMMRLREPKHELSKVVSDHTLWSRRIWMLAVNHARPELGQEAGRALRRAIAFAINREEVLSIFRAGTANHQPLDGPFPPGTWAVPESPRKLFDPERAGFEAKNSKVNRVTLKFVDDPLARQACEKIKAQVAQVGIDIELAPLNPADFHRAVMLEHDYELAYVPYDYNNEMSLRGLFDVESRGRGERNFMSYVPDAKIGQRLTTLSSTRDFNKIRDTMHLLYTTFDDQMPFIPLWQLNSHVIISQKVDTMPGKDELDPLTIFNMVEEWRLNR